MKQLIEDFLRPHVMCEQPKQKVYSNKRPVMNGKGKIESRLVDNVVGICIHQTAVEYGVSKRQIEAEIRAGEQVPVQAALHHRFYKVPYHVVALRCGDILYNNDFWRYTYHGNGCNSFTLGLAIEGKYPGSSWTGFNVETAREALRFAVNKGREEGCPISLVTSHRQWSKNRKNDPGRQIWSDVVIPLLSELNLELDPRFGGGGNAVPDEWSEI